MFEKEGNYAVKEAKCIKMLANLFAKLVVLKPPPSLSPIAPGCMTIAVSKESQSCSAYWI